MENQPLGGVERRAFRELQVHQEFQARRGLRLGVPTGEGLDDLTATLTAEQREYLDMAKLSADSLLTVIDDPDAEIKAVSAFVKTLK